MRHKNKKSLEGSVRLGITHSPGKTPNLEVTYTNTHTHLARKTSHTHTLIAWRCNTYTLSEPLRMLESFAGESLWGGNLLVGPGDADYHLEIYLCRLPLLFIAAVHCGQYHFPLGASVKPTQP